MKRYYANGSYWTGGITRSALNERAKKNSPVPPILGGMT